MHKCTWGFVLLFAVPLLAKPFVVRKVLQTAPKPGVVRDREVEEVAKVKGWGLLTASPGDTIGSSQYDWQWNAAPIRRIVYDPILGNTHVTWMHQVGGERHMFYNFYDGTWAFGTGIGGGTAVQTTVRDGYGAIDYTTDGCAVVSLHGGATEADYKSRVCVDLMAGGGGFDCVGLPNPPPGEIKVIWPRVAVDGSNNMIVVASTDSVVGQHDSLPTPRNWSRSTDGAGATWSNWVPFDTATGLAYNIFASKSSNKFCMVWGKDSLENGSYSGHIVYKESNNAGANWGNLVDINTLIPLPPAGRTYTPLQLRNSVGNCYGIYDSQDNIHLVTDASLGTDKPGRYYPFMACVLWHYSSATSTMNPIAIHSFPYNQAVEKPYPYYGQWMAKPVIAEDPTTKYLYVGWIEFPHDSADTNGYGMGEIYCSYSLDGGATWAPKLNLTMTPENCEVFLSMAPIVDETLRIFYMFDKNNHSNITADPPGLDPDTCLFQYFEAPIGTGNVEVVQLIDVPDTLESPYTPKAVYKNKGTAAVSFQARYELTLPGIATTQEGFDTLFAPSIFYYDIINVVGLAAGATDTVEFKTWQPDSGFSEGGLPCYCAAYATLLIDTDLSDNLKGDSSFVGIEEHDSRFAIHDLRLESYPNPVRGNASIKYTVPTTAKLNIKVYDITGKLVTTLVDRSHKPGTYTINWNGMDYRGREVPGGIYFYRLTSDKFKESTTRKIVILR